MACCGKKMRDMFKQGANKALNNQEGMLQKLTSTDFLTIDARVDWIECMQLCETQNQYKLYQCANDQFNINFQEKEFGVFQEKSDCCCRFFVRHMREFKATLKFDGFEVATCETKYKCHSWNPCCSCPCDFPELYILHNGNLIGCLRVPYYVCCCGKKGNTCSIMEMDIVDAQNQPIYRLTGNCCQKSVWCLPFMCCGCEQIRYDIREPQTIGQQLQPGQQMQDLAVGSIRNVCKDCPEETFTKSDKFGVQFPKNADGKRRLLLVFAAIYLDYLSYEAFP